MLQIQIPDHLAAEAARKAAAIGMSLERFVLEAVQLHLHDDDEDESVTLTPDQVAVILRARADIEAGKGSSIKQVRAELAANRASWRQDNLD